MDGALAQGLGQALLERVVYDEGGALVTGSLLDYAAPRAGDLPAWITGHIDMPLSADRVWEALQAALTRRPLIL